MNWQKYHPKHVFQYCPKCGQKGFEMISEKQFHCKKCDLPLYINQSSTVVAIIMNNNGEVMLAKRGREPEKGKWDLPGGFVDIGETAESATVREIKEELNLDITELRYLGSSPNEYVYSDLTYFVLDSCFVCKVETLEDIKVDDDVVDYKFVKIEDIDYSEIAFHTVKFFVEMLQKVMSV